MAANRRAFVSSPPQRTTVLEGRLIWYQDRVVNSALDGLRPQMFLEVLPVALYQNGEKMVNRIRAMGLGRDLQLFRYNVASVTGGNLSSPFGKLS